jgi:hypothetical protein
VAGIAWLPAHLDDVRSDFSVFHRVDDLDVMPADKFFAYLLRIAAYGGAVALTARSESEPPVPPVAAAEPPRVAPMSPSLDQFAEMNKSSLYGPLGSQRVGMFEIG